MMLDLKNHPNVLGASKLHADDDIGAVTDIVRLFLKRRYKMAVLLMALGLTLGVAYLKRTQPSYTASVVIEIANREGKFLQQQATLTELPADIDRHVTLAKSLRVAKLVAEKLNLAADPEFDPPASSFVLRLRSLWAGGSVDAEAWRADMTVTSLMSGMRVVPDNSGLALEIAFTSHDPQKAADIANEIADTVISLQSGADAEIHKKAADWLVGQSDELANRQKDATAAVAEFVKANNLVLVEGKPLDQKNLEDVSKRVTEAKEKLDAARYRLDKIAANLTDAATRNILDATSAAEIVQDPVIAKARDRYSDLSNQIGAIRRDYGKDSQKLQELMANAKTEILEQLARLQNNARNDLALAGARYVDLLGEQKAAMEASHRAISLNSQLKELQATEQNYRTLYQNFLQHSAESVQELSFPVRAARISERATPPLAKSWPKPFIVLAATAIGGLVLGFGVGALRDFADGGLRTSVQFEAATQLKCLALVPLAAISKSALKASAVPAEFAERFARTPHAPIWTKIKTTPNSRFVSELVALRVALFAASGSQSGQVFGFTSALPGEGKSSLVASFGVLMAQFGHRVVVVDLDFRNPTLTDMFTPERRRGISDVLLGRCALEDVLTAAPGLGLTVAPSGADMNVMQTVELLSSLKMRECVAKLRQTYEIVVLDLPPLLPTTDVRATIDWVDKYVLVVEWAKTNKALLRRAMEASPYVTAKMAGGVLNKVNFKSLSNYDALGTSYYMRPEFTRYFDPD